MDFIIFLFFATISFLLACKAAHYIVGHHRKWEGIWGWIIVSALVPPLGIVINSLICIYKCIMLNTPTGSIIKDFFDKYFG